MVSQREVPPAGGAPLGGGQQLWPQHSSGLSYLPVAPPRETARTLTPAQFTAIREAMRIFVEDDLARGVSAAARLYCDACERPRPAAGSITYGRYALCNNCAIEYEAARARGMLGTPGQYVRDKHFGEGDLYVLPD